MDNALIISDTHFPFHHRDTFDFLEAAADAYDCHIIKHTGDMVDNHNGSFHEVEYGVMSSKDEHRAAYACVQRLSDMFPIMDVVLGNHGIMSYRKAKAAGIPVDHMKSYNDMYDVNWEWEDKFLFPVANKDDKCLLVHSIGANTLSNAQRYSHNSIQGHHHGRLGIEYAADTERMRWSMTCGCLVDHNSPAFNYAKGATLNRQLIGCGSIIEDEPHIIRMRLTKSGRWNKRI